MSTPLFSKEYAIQCFRKFAWADSALICYEKNETGALYNSLYDYIITDRPPKLAPRKDTHEYKAHWILRTLFFEETNRLLNNKRKYPISNKMRNNLYFILWCIKKTHPLLSKDLRAYLGDWLIGRQTPLKNILETMMRNCAYLERYFIENTQLPWNAELIHGIVSQIEEEKTSEPSLKRIKL